MYQIFSGVCVCVCAFFLSCVSKFVFGRDTFQDPSRKFIPTSNRNDPQVKCRLEAHKPSFFFLFLIFIEKVADSLIADRNDSIFALNDHSQCWTKSSNQVLTLT